MTDIISSDRLEILKPGRTELHISLLHQCLDHYSCDEYFATLINKCRSLCILFLNLWKYSIAILKQTFFSSKM